MITYDVAITIDRPPAEVFPYLTDVTRYPSWMGGTSAEPTTEGPVRVGYRYAYQTDEGRFKIEVTAYQEGRSVSHHTVAGPMSWSGTFAVEPGGDPTSSRVISRGAYQLTGLKRLLQPFVGGEIAKREQHELELLKKLAEGVVS